MSKTHKCHGCDDAPLSSTTQIRVYKRTRQWQFRFELCSTCEGALFDLLKSSSSSWSDGLWSPEVSGGPLLPTGFPGSSPGQQQLNDLRAHKR